MYFHVLIQLPPQNECLEISVKEYAHFILDTHFEAACPKGSFFSYCHDTALFPHLSPHRNDSFFKISEL